MNVYGGGCQYLPYEQMWWRLRHKVEEEYATLGEVAAGQQMRQQETDCMRGIEGDAKKTPTPIMFPGFDFRDMWFQLCHKAEEPGGDEKYGPLRLWMRELEQQALSEAKEFDLIAIIDKLMEFYTITKPERAEARDTAKKTGSVSGFPESAAYYRLTRIISELVNLVEAMKVEAMKE